MRKFKEITGYEGLYKVNDLGKVVSLKTGKARKVNYCNDYPLILLCKDGIKKMFKMHIMVATLFVPNPFNKPQVNHKNGNKRDFRAKNLEWSTPKENIQHAVDNGLRCHIGEKNPMSTTSAKRRALILSHKQEGLSTVTISKMFGVSRETVCRIYRRNQKRTS